MERRWRLFRIEASFPNLAEQSDGSHARPISLAAADLMRPSNCRSSKGSQLVADGQWIAHWEGVEVDHLSRFTES
jgi:hypothetical protein